MIGIWFIVDEINEGEGLYILRSEIGLYGEMVCFYMLSVIWWKYSNFVFWFWEFCWSGWVGDKVRSRVICVYVWIGVWWVLKCGL